MDAAADNPEPAEDLEAGARLGRYEVIRLVGRGGFGAVYEATHRELRKRVALKVLHREFALHPTVRTRFSREAVVASGLRHPHVVDVTDVGVFEGQPYLVMEFLEGETLRGRCESAGVMAVADALDVLLPVIDAIATAHAQGIVHRDLKPDNVFLARVGPRGAEVPKVLDFGIVKMSGDLPDRKGTLTGSGAILGTPAYMSPEQAQNLRDIDGRSDQFSLGAILYECVTGQRAFAGEGMISVLHRVAMEPVTPPRALRPDLPEGFEAVVLRALEKSPAARFETTRLFGAALLPFASARAQEQWSATLSGDEVARPSAPPASVSAGRVTPGLTSREVGPQTLHRGERAPSRGSRWPLVVALTAGIALLLAGADALRERRSATVSPTVTATPQHAASAAPTLPPPTLPPPVVVVPPVVAPVVPVVVAAPPARVTPSVHRPATRRNEQRVTGADAGVTADAGRRHRVLGPNGAVIED